MEKNFGGHPPGFTAVRCRGLFDREVRATQLYPLINWTDIHTGMIEFQRRNGLLAPLSHKPD